MVQYPAIAAIPMDIGYTNPFLYLFVFLKGRITIANTVTITAICPNSTPALNAKMEV